MKRIQATLPPIALVGLIVTLTVILGSCGFLTRDTGGTSTPGVTISPSSTHTPIVIVIVSSTPVITPTSIFISIENIANLGLISEWEVGPLNQAPVAQDFIHDIAWSPNSVEFAVSASKGNSRGIEVFDILTSQRLWSFKNVLSLSLAFSPDGNLLAVSNLTPRSITFWDISTGDTVLEVEGVECLAGDFIVFHPDGKTVVTGYGIGQDAHELSLISWDVDSGQCRGVLTHGDGLPISLGIDSKSGRLIAAVIEIQEEAREQVILWELDTGEQVCNVPGIMVAFSQDEDIMAVLDRDRRTIGIFSIVACNLLRTFRVDTDVYSFDLSPSGEILAVGGERFQLWDSSTGDKVHEVKGITNTVRQLSFSPNGRFILAASSADPGQRNKVTLWGLQP